MQLFCHVFLIWMLFSKFLYSHTPEQCKLYVVINTWAFEDPLWSCCHLFIDSIKGEMASVIILTVYLCCFSCHLIPVSNLVLEDGFIHICNYPFCRNWIFNIWQFLSEMWKICSIRYSCEAGLIIWNPFGQFLHLESTFEEKDYVCERMVEFLMGAAKREASDTLSFQLLEALLFRVQLHIFTGRCQSALAILQVSIYYSI